MKNILNKKYKDIILGLLGLFLLGIIGSFVEEYINPSNIMENNYYIVRCK